MVEYGGTRMEEVVPAAILDIVVQPPGINATARSGTVRDGALFIRRTLGPRDVTVSFDIREPEYGRRQWYVQRLLAWLAPNTPQTLRVDHYPGRHLTAVCTNVSLTGMRDWWEDLSVTFTAYDPAWTADREREAAVGEKFLVAGSLPPLVRIEHSVEGTLTAPRWTLLCGDQQTGPHIEARGTVYGKGLAVDFPTRTVSNINQTLPITLQSRWGEALPGANRFLPNESASGRVYWRERWI